MTLINKNSIIQKKLPNILVAVLILIALFTFKDYDMSWDESIQKETGRYNLEYILSENEDLLSWQDKDYGPAFELLLSGLERVFSFENTHEIYFMRHLVTHLFFLLAAFLFFKLIYLLYGNSLLATIGFLFLVLRPRIYGHSFFNTKDLPFLPMFIICFYLTAIAFKEKKMRNFILLGGSIGLLIDMRIMGVMLFAFIAILLFIDALREKNTFFTQNRRDFCRLFFADGLYFFPFFMERSYWKFYTGI